MALKRPYAISFSKKNEIRPFEPSGAASLEFFASKNDASLFLIGMLYCFYNHFSSINTRYRSIDEKTTERTDVCANV